MPAALSTYGDGTSRLETVTIFDWDDTLLASSFLAQKGFNRLDACMNRSPDVDAQLKELEHAVIAILSRAAEFGRVHIITNAETGWVQLSAQTFIPGVLPFLDKVLISSARSQYEPVFPAAPVQWKYCAFHDKIVTTFGECANLERNVVSLGDSRVEREAVLTVCRGLPQTRCKSIKFAERPTLEQLRLQLELVTQCYAEICHHDTDLDLQLSLLAETPSPPPSPSTPTTTPSSSTTSNNSSNTDAMVCVPLAGATATTTPISPSSGASTDPMDTDGNTSAAAAAAVRQQRVQLIGYQPFMPVAPFAVACGAFSQLVVQANGTAVVVPSASAAAAAATGSATAAADIRAPPAAAAATAALTAALAPPPPASPTCSVVAAAAVAAAAAAAASLNGVEVVEVGSKALVSDDLVCRTPRQTAVMS